MSKEHLIPATKGDVRNPKGRGHAKGKKTEFLEIINALYDGTNPLTNKKEKVDGITKLKFELMRIAVKSKNDNARINAIRELLERTEGKIVQKMDFSVVERAREVKALFPTEDELRLLDEANKPELP